MVKYAWKFFNPTSQSRANPQKEILMSGQISEKICRSLVQTLKIPLFRGVNYETAVEIISYFEKKQYQLNDTIVRYGDPGDEMFIIVSGEAAVKVSGITVHTFGPGDIIGEVCLINEKSKRTATILSASSKLILLSINRFGYDEIRRNMPLIIETLTKNIGIMISEKLEMANNVITTKQNEIQAERESSKELLSIKEGSILTRLKAILNFGK